MVTKFLNARKTKNLLFPSFLISCFYIYFSLNKNNRNDAELKNINEEVVVMVLTTEKSILDRGKAVWETWGKDNTNFLFTLGCSSIKEIKALKEKNQNIPDALKPFKKTLNMPIHCLDIVESYNQMGQKVFMVLQDTYDIYKNKANWYLLVDDDTFVFSENLVLFTKSQNSSEKSIYGFKWKGMYDYIGGGAGMLFSGEAMKVLVDKIRKRECDQYLEGYGDISIGNCAYQLGIQPIYPLDNEGKPYFHPHTTKEHYKGPLPVPLYTSGSHNGKIGKDCCSNNSVTFHYVQPAEMYTMYENKNFISDLLSDKIIFT